MKRIMIFLTIIGIVGLVMTNFGNKTTVAKGENDLLTMASVLQDENIIIREWSLYAREKLEMFQSLQEVKKYAGELEQEYSDWEWTTRTTDTHWEATAVLKVNDEKSEMIKVLSTLTNDEAQTYVIYEIKGQEWEQDLEQDLAGKMDKRFSDIFRGIPTIFSCIKGEFSDKISESLPDTVAHFMTAFQATELEALKEDQFISTSAYSPMFNGGVETNGKDMNLQLGIRTEGLGAKTNLVIGTPIITIEY